MPHRKNIPLEAVVKAYEKHRTYEGAGAELGCDPSNVRKRLMRLWALETGKANEDYDIPNYVPGSGRAVRSVSKQMDRYGEVKFFSVREEPETDEEEFAKPLGIPRRVSTLRGADGSIRSQWEITVREDEDRAKAVMDSVEGFKEEIPRAMPIANTVEGGENLANLYVLSDAHIGALAWHRESGGDWDLKIAEDTWVNAMGAMIAQSPRANTGILALLGDWMHYDKFEAVTTLSGNILDSDGRQPKMNKVAIRVARKVLALALRHHAKVELLVAEGNHDIIGAPWLRELFIAAYEMEPRLNIIDDPRPYYCIMVGDVFVGFHHGHLKGGQNIKTATELVAVFADEFREEWGRAKHVEIHTGHYHNAVETNPRGGRVIQHPTLATRGSWEARKGWDGLRAARSITYHKNYGRTGTVEVTPEMLADV